MSLTVHHVGIVVNNIDEHVVTLPGASIEKRIFDDTQKSNLAICRVSTGTRIELIEPLPDLGSTYNFLVKKGDSLHHICYELDSADLKQTIQRYRMTLISRPVFAPLFDRNIVFAFTRKGILVEFVLNG